MHLDHTPCGTVMVKRCGCAACTLGVSCWAPNWIWKDFDHSGGRLKFNRLARHHALRDQRFVSLPRQHKKFSDTNAFQRATDRTCTSLLFATFDGGTICGSAIPPNFCAPPICLTCCRKAINSWIFFARNCPCLRPVFVTCTRFFALPFFLIDNLSSNLAEAVIFLVTRPCFPLILRIIDNLLFNLEAEIFRVSCTCFTVFPCFFLFDNLSSNLVEARDWFCKTSATKLLRYCWCFLWISSTCFVRSVLIILDIWRMDNGHVILISARG